MLGGRLARSGGVESHSIFPMLCVNLPNGTLLLCVEIQLLDWHLRIKKREPGTD